MTRTAEAQALIDSYTQEVNLGPLGEHGRPFAINIYTRAVDDAFKVFEKLKGKALDELLGVPRASPPFPLQMALEEIGTPAQADPPKAVPAKFTLSDAQALLDAHAKKAPPTDARPAAGQVREGYLVPPGFPPLPTGVTPKGPVRRFPARDIHYTAPMKTKLLPAGTYYTDDVELFELGRCLNGLVRAHYQITAGPSFATGGEWIYYHLYEGNLSIETLRGSAKARGVELRKALVHLHTHINLENFERVAKPATKVEEE